MPLLVPCEDLQPGMRLAEAFLWRRRMMLPGGKVLTETDVQALRHKYPTVCLRVSDPVLDAVAEFEDDSREREAAVTVCHRIATCMSEVQERYTTHTSLASVNFQDAKTAVTEVVDFLGRHSISAALLDLSTDSHNPLADHTGTVFYLTTVLATAARDYIARERQRQTSAAHLAPDVAMNLVPLGLGAMFMDVGMYPIQRVFADEYVLTDEDRRLIREHPMTGADLLPEILPTGVKMIVRTHHENFDGTGYPKGMAGRSLHVFTRVVRVCDAFAAATSRRAYRGAKSLARAVWEMTAGPYRRFYDPALMKAFASLIHPFPIGARLRLADGRHAVVVRYNRKEPLRPYVVIAFDAAGHRLGKAQLVGPIAAASDAGTRIASFAGEDLSYLYSEPDPEPAPQAVLAPAETKPAREIGSLLEAGYP